jgi:chorismate-pyruvate lyase
MHKNNVSLISGVIWKQPRQFTESQLPCDYRRILLDSGSFTERLRAMTAQLGLKFQIKVLQEDLRLTHGLEREQRIFDCRYVFTREVQICIENQVLMFAISRVAKNCAQHFKEQFRSLRQNPLGGILHKKQYRLTRSSFELAKILPSQREYHFVLHADSIAPDFVWARRSLFCNTTPVLSLSEYYSPYLLNLMVAHHAL